MTRLHDAKLVLSSSKRVGSGRGMQFVKTIYYYMERREAIKIEKRGSRQKRTNKIKQYTGYVAKC